MSPHSRLLPSLAQETYLSTLLTKGETNGYHHSRAELALAGIPLREDGGGFYSSGIILRVCNAH
jgi:hypothetical protein